jgi:hypothetical protein
MNNLEKLLAEYHDDLALRLRSLRLRSGSTTGPSTGSSDNWQQQCRDGKAAEDINMNMEGEGTVF